MYYTYQDLMKIGSDRQKRADFVYSAISEYRTSKEYQAALEANLYYDGENPTINRYEKIIYDLEGRAHRDMWTANHKIATWFFGFAVDQEISYLLGNGVTFKKDRTKKELGKDFDQLIMKIGRYALIGGAAFGFWNLDHLEVFKRQEFIPLYDEEDGGLKAGIQFWQLAGDKPLRATLFEMDGYTGYREDENHARLEVFRPKRAYRQIIRSSDGNGKEILDGEPYPGFPIVPLRNGENSKSALNGRRNTIDALDLAVSGMVNNVDEGNLIYWIINNAGGMGDDDDAKFIDRIRTLHVAHTDDAASAEPHSIEAPFQGTNATIDMLLKRLFADFQCFDSSAVTASNQSATAVRASYIPLDLKVDKFEAEVTSFINAILELAGIEDEPTYTRNPAINRQEEIQTVLLCAQYLDDEYITRKILTILGDADQYDEIMKRRDAEDMQRLSAVQNQTEEETGDVTTTG